MTRCGEDCWVALETCRTVAPKFEKDGKGCSIGNMIIGGRIGQKLQLRAGIIDEE
jgi:hypothetical protein